MCASKTDDGWRRNRQITKISQSLRSRRKHKAQGEAKRTLGRFKEINQSPWNGRQNPAGVCRPRSRAGTRGHVPPRVSLRFTLGFMLPPAPQARLLELV